LESWGHGCKLVIVTTLFWRSDDKKQSSIEGFYRSVLFHTLRQCPELIPEVFPGQDIAKSLDTGDFHIKQLQSGFEKLVQQTRALDKYRFCFFIDGLDEYEGGGPKNTGGLDDS
jgi:hypothetical protein